MAIEATQLNMLAIERESFGRKAGFPETDARRVFIIPLLGDDVIELGS